MSNQDSETLHELSEGGFKTIDQKHNIPKTNAHVLTFSKLGSESRNIKDGESFILPYSRLGENEYWCLVRHPDDEQFAPCYLLWEEEDLLGWCQCSEFGVLGVCRHLYIQYQWQSGLLVPQNKTAATKLKDYLEDAAKREK